MLAALSLDLKVGLAKGRRRFLCLIKLDQLLEGASDSASASPLFPDEISGNASIAEGKLQTLLDAYMDKRWDGDRDHWVERSMTMNGEHSAQTERSALIVIADSLKRALFLLVEPI